MKLKILYTESDHQSTLVSIVYSDQKQLRSFISLSFLLETPETGDAWGLLHAKHMALLHK